MVKKINETKKKIPYPIYMAPFALRRHVGSNRKDVHDMRNPSI